MKFKCWLEHDTEDEAKEIEADTYQEAAQERGRNHYLIEDGDYVNIFVQAENDTAPIKFEVTYEIIHSYLARRISLE